MASTTVSSDWPANKSRTDGTINTASSVSAAIVEVAAELEANLSIRTRLRDACCFIDRVVGELYYEIITATSFDTASFHSLVARIGAAGQQLYRETNIIVPEGTFFENHDVVKRAWREMALLLQYLHYRQSGKILTHPEMLLVLHDHTDTTAGTLVQFDFEDYLCAQVLVASEVARRAMQAALAGNLAEVEQSVEFCDAILKAEQLMNFKNNELRRIYDSLKYECAFVRKLHAELSFVVAQKGRT